MTAKEQIVDIEKRYDAYGVSGPFLMDCLRGEGWEVIRLLNDYMTLDGETSSYVLSKLTKGSVTLWHFWAREWWINELHETRPSPSDFS